MQILFLLLIAHGLFVTPWMLQNLFNWYLYDMLDVYMTYKQAMGIEFICSFLTFSITRKADNKTFQEICEYGISYAIGVWIFFSVAFLIKEFVLN